MRSNASGGFAVVDGNSLLSTNSQGLVLNTVNLPFAPTAMAVDNTGLGYLGDANGNLYKLDSGNNSVVLATLPNKLISLVWGSQGLVGLESDGSVVALSGGGGSTLLGQVNGATRLAVDEQGKAFVCTGTQVYSVAGGTITLQSSAVIGSSGFAVAASHYYVVDGGGLAVNIYDASGNASVLVQGFSSPMDLVANGNGFLFADSSNRIMSWQANQLPVLLRNDTSASYLSYSQGQLYAVQSNTVWQINPSNGQRQNFFSESDLNSLSAVAFRGDGSFAVADRNDSRVAVFSAQNTLQSNYLALNAPQALSVDSSGNIYVFLAANRQVVKLDPNATTSSFFGPQLPQNNGYGFMTFGPNGSLYIAGDTGYGPNGKESGGVMEIAPDGSGFQRLQINTTSLMNGVAVLGNQLILADSGNNSLWRAALDGSSNILWAIGMSTPKGVRVAGDGSVFITDQGTGSVLRYTAANGLQTLKMGYGPLSRLALAPDGLRVYVGTDTGGIDLLDNGGNNIDYETYRTLGNVQGIAARTDGSLLVLDQQNPRILVGHLPGLAPSTPATPGTVVQQWDADLPFLPIAGAAVTVPLGNFQPATQGDFTINVTSENGATGSVSAALHVGPHPNGNIVPDQGQLMPGTQTLGLNVNLTGLDLTKIAQLNPSAWTRTYVYNKNPYYGYNPTVWNMFNCAADIFTKPVVTPNNMILAVVNNCNAGEQGAIVQFNPGGGDPSYLFKSTAFQIYARSLVVDASNNVYFVRFDNAQVVKLGPNSTLTTIAQLPVFVPSPNGNCSGPDDCFPQSAVDMDMDYSGNLIVHTGVDVRRISLSGQVTVLDSATISPQSSPYAGQISSDKNGFVYVNNDTGRYLTAGERWSDTYVARIFPDGKSTDILNIKDQDNEFYALISMTSDPLGNLYFIDENAWGAFDTGKAIGSYNVNTGQVQLLLPANPDPMEPFWQMNDLHYNRYFNRLELRLRSAALTDLSISADVLMTTPLQTGGLSAELHILTAPGGGLSGFSTAPTSQIPSSTGGQEYIWSLQNLNAQGLNMHADSLLNGLQLGQQAPVVQDAYLQIANDFATGSVRIPITIPSLPVQNLFQINLLTDKSSYPSNSAGVASLTVTNNNLADFNGTLQVQWLDGNGAQVALLSSGPLQAPHQTSIGQTVPFNTGTIYAGNYRLRATVFDSSGNSVAIQEATFSILPGSSSASNGLQTSLTPSKPTYYPTDTANLRARLNNTALNQLYTNVSIALTVTTPGGATLYQETRAVNNLSAGQLMDTYFNVPLNNTGDGVYTGQIVVSADGQPLSTATGQFTVIDNANSLLQKVSAQINLGATSFQVGQPVAIGVNINDIGASALSALPIQIGVVNAAGQTVLQTWQNSLNLLPGTTSMLTESWSSANTAAGTYQVVASVLLNGQWQPLAIQSFSLTAPQVQLGVTQSINVAPATNRVLVLLGCHVGSVDAFPDARGTGKGAPTCAQRQAFVGQLLAQQGYAYTIATAFGAESANNGISTPLTFREALRSGDYSTIWMMMGVDTPDTTLAEEINGAVYRGATLITEGSYVSWGATDFSLLLGLNTLSTPLPSKVISFTDANWGKGAIAVPDVLNSWSLTTSADIANFLPAIGPNGLPLPAIGPNGLPLPSCNSTPPVLTECAPSGPLPAIVQRSYGKGRTLSFAFDWLGTLMTANLGTGQPWTKVLQNAISNTPVAETGLQPGRRFTIGTQIANQGTVATTVDQTTSWPSLFSSLSSQPQATLTSSSADWQQALALAATDSTVLELRAPLVPTSYSVSTAVQTGTSGAWTPYQVYPLSVVVEDPLAQLKTALSAAVSLQQQTSNTVYTQVIASLNRAAAAWPMGNWTALVSALADANEELDAAGPAAASLRTSVVQLLASAEYRVYLSHLQ